MNEAKPPMYEALGEYLALRDELAELEAREDECRCDVMAFYTCELCRVATEKHSKQRNLMTLWGDNWAVALSQKIDQGETQ